MLLQSVRMCAYVQNACYIYARIYAFFRFAYIRAYAYSPTQEFSGLFDGIPRNGASFYVFFLQFFEMATPTSRLYFFGDPGHFILLW
jgi:hypothetical protein